MRGRFVFSRITNFRSRDAACDHNSLPLRVLRVLHYARAWLRLPMKRSAQVGFRGSLLAPHSQKLAARHDHENKQICNRNPRPGLLLNESRLPERRRQSYDSSQFTISSHRSTLDLAAVMPLAYNIALLIYVRSSGRLAKLPIILRLALCDRWLVFERIPRSFVWMLHCAGARWCCRAMCSLEYRNAVRPLGASMCVSLCLRSE